MAAENPPRKAIAESELRSLSPCLPDKKMIAAAGDSYTAFGCNIDEMTGASPVFRVVPCFKMQGRRNLSYTGHFVDCSVTEMNKRSVNDSKQHPLA